MKLLAVTLLTLSIAVSAADSISEQRRGIVTNWNAFKDSVDRQNPVLTEIQNSYLKYPPWMVNSEAAVQGRKEKLRLAVNEAKEQVRRLEALERAE